MPTEQISLLAPIVFLIDSAAKQTSCRISFYRFVQKATLPVCQRRVFDTGHLLAPSDRLLSRLSHYQAPSERLPQADNVPCGVYKLVNSVLTNH